MAGMRERFAAVTSELLDREPRAVVVLADISGDLFVPAARRHPDRVVNVGIREQLMVSVSGGLALSGMRPVVHTYAPFLIERAWEQVKLDLTHQDVGAVLVSIGASYDAAPSGRTHQAPGDVALLDTLPGWRVEVPGHADEAEAALRRAIRGDGRVYLRLSTASNGRPYDAGDGRLVVVRTGNRGAVLAVGPLLDPVLAATENLDVTVLYAATVRPLDTTTLRRTLREPAVVLVEPYLAGTSAYVVTSALADIPHRLLCLGVRNPELHRYGTPADHDQLHGLDVAGLRHAVGAFLAGEGGSDGGVEAPRVRKPSVDAGNDVGVQSAGRSGLGRCGKLGQVVQ